MYHINRIISPSSMMRSIDYIGQKSLYAGCSQSDCLCSHHEKVSICSLNKPLFRTTDIEPFIHIFVDFLYMLLRGNPGNSRSIDSIPDTDAGNGHGNADRNGWCIGNLKLIGSQNVVRAEKAFGNALCLNIVLSAIIMIVGLSTAESWLNLVGASETIIPYALDYLTFILVGMIFQTFSMANNGLITSEGNAGVAMMGMVIGAGSLSAIFVNRALAEYDDDDAISTFGILNRIMMLKSYSRQTCNSFLGMIYSVGEECKMNWKTRITSLLGCKYPILQGAFAGFGRWDFAASIANTGVHGMITASVSGTPEKLREDIRKCREATEGTFSVNLTLTHSLPWNELLEVCIEEGVPLETAAYKPDDLVPRIKEAGLTWIHKAARVKDAIRAAKLGADAVIIVGLEGTGFKSPEQLTTMVSLVWALKELDVPVVAAGGIGDARSLLGALSMGADAIMMGTAFMATKECPLNNRMKETIIQTGFDNAELRHQVLSVADPEDLAEVMKLRGTVPTDQWLLMLERVNLKDPHWREPDSRNQGGDSRLRMVSFAAGDINEVKPVNEFILGLIEEAEEIAEGWSFNREI